MRVLPENLLNLADASVNQTSIQGLLAHAFGYHITVLFTGTVTGTVKLQGSNDPVPDGGGKPVRTFPVINWEDIAGSTGSVTGAGNVDYEAATAFYNWVRVVYTAASGTGTINVTLNTKGF